MTKLEFKLSRAGRHIQELLTNGVKPSQITEDEWWAAASDLHILERLIEEAKTAEGGYRNEKEQSKLHGEQRDPITAEVLDEIFFGNNGM